MSKVNNRFLATSIREGAKRHFIYSREEKRRKERKRKERKKERKAWEFFLKNIKFLPCV